ncbi:MAG: amidase [Alphaproteobacteria bacterium]|nr:amidase [Alphaproteobacteria bacterium]
MNAFVPGGIFTLAGAADGPLAGLSFAAKDIFDIAGHVTGCGNPDWARTHVAADDTQSAVRALLDAGATLKGKTITDELAFSLMGENAHYGTPVNAAAPARVPGGSSCGSAAAVAGGAVDFALGSDTGGSVRIPASHCGIFGIRTTHGRLSLDRTMKLAPSFDVLGWFARDAGVLRRVGAVLLGDAPRRARAGGLFLAQDAFALADPAVGEALRDGIERVVRAIGPAAIASVAPEGLGAWYDAFRHLQGAEIWRVHGEWVTRTQPRFGPGVAERFRWVATIGRDEVAAAAAVRARARARLRQLLDSGKLLCLPTAPSPAPLKGLPLAETDRFRARTLSLTCIAGLAGLPQVTLPLGRVDGAPVGLSLIGPAGADAMLLDLAEAVWLS